MAVPKKVNKRARMLVRQAMQKGMSFEDVAGVCGVAVGSVKRWLATGRADADKIAALEAEVGAVYLSPETVAEDLADIYRSRKRRFRVTKDQLRRISGRSDLRDTFLNALGEALTDRGFYFLPGHVDGEEMFLIISHVQLAKHVAENLEKSDVESYFQELAEWAPDED